MKCVLKRLFEKLLCKHKYKVIQSVEVSSEFGTRLVLVQECRNCGKVRKITV